MVKSTIRTTVVFSPKTARALEWLGRKWNASKSETLRRIIEERALGEQRKADARLSPAEALALMDSGKIELLDVAAVRSFMHEVAAERAAAK